jgi:predicted RNA-binding Zn-ribbon protein involved in translation (DUF1610 family)
MEQTTEIRCPKCGSNQIAANKKGFSGGKALVGGILTGGVGLLAGTIGSKKLIITCLSCGKEFKPGEGKTFFVPIVQGVSKEISSNMLNTELDSIDQRILELCKEGNKLKALVFCKDAKSFDLKTSKDYVENLVMQYGISSVNTKKQPSKGAWIFTKVFLIIVVVFISMLLISMVVVKEWTMFVLFLVAELFLILFIIAANKKIKELKEIEE